MNLYNTLTRQISRVDPLQPPRVTVYTCGPTVYDYSHIGHWYNYVRMDMLIRALRADGLEPVWVMNITDVGHLVSDADEGEDKLQRGARREGKTAWEIAAIYTADFVRGMELLNISRPDHMPRATEHISEQIELIRTLESKGYTYAIDDGIYFDISRFPDYGRFARLDLDEQQPGGRVAQNDQKRQPADFALWKFSPPNDKRDMEWNSPWGVGYPGWHIECSAMSMHYLGPTLDIHTGGIDHIPVHHTNEIAQSQAATGQPLARHWMHSNHVLVDGHKIAKSAGNGIRLQQIFEHGITAEAVRIAILESHYRTQSHFSLQNLQAAQNRLQDLYAAADMIWQTTAQSATDTSGSDYRAAIRTDIYQPLLNDLDTPLALANISRRLSAALLQPLPAGSLDGYKAYLGAMDSALGTRMLGRPDITPAQKSLIAKRQKARQDRDWAESDRLRLELSNQGIGVSDTTLGPIWRRLLPEQHQAAPAGRHGSSDNQATISGDNRPPV